jgi:hypothetical protein
MAGTKNDVMVAKNADFTQTNAPNASSSESNGLVTDGKLWIGSTAVNAGGTHINVGSLTSPGATVTVGYSSPNITLEAGATVATTYITDSGNATPAANQLNVLGGPGVTTTGSGNTVTINSTVFTDTTATTMAVDNGYFATAAGTYNLPATAAQGELITIVCDTAGAVVVDAPALNFVRIGSLITSSGGTATSTSIGDSLTLRYRLSTLTWECTSCIGTWVLA